MDTEFLFMQLEKRRILYFFYLLFEKPFQLFENYELDLHSVYNFYYLSSSLNQMEQHIYNNMLQAKSFFISPAVTYLY